jgi:aspartate/methionine/tyrosine aminotransferase
MRWAKSRPAAKFDLAMSNMVSVTKEELPGLFDGVALDGAIPDGYPPLRQAIARYYGVEDENVALGGGCSGANFLVCAALLSAGDEVVAEHPVYDPLVGAARIVGGKVVNFERRFEEGWRIDPERAASHMTSRTRLVILSSAYNPTGVRADAGALHALGQAAAERDAWILVDEAYGALVHRGEAVSAMHAHPRVIITGSFTKSHGLNGLRCGWAVGNPDAIARVRLARDTVDAVGVYPAEVASARAFDHIDMLEARARNRVMVNLETVRAFIASRDELSWVEPDGGTVAFIKLNGVDDATPFVTRLFDRFETAVGPGHFFGAPGFFRISFGGDPENLSGGLNAIERCLDTDAE